MDRCDIDRCGVHVCYWFHRLYNLPWFQVLIGVRDDGSPARTSTTTVTLTVNVYRNQYIPQFINVDSDPASINENLPVSGLIRTVTATDGDRVVRWNFSFICQQLSIMTSLSSELCLLAAASLTWCLHQCLCNFTVKQILSLWMNSNLICWVWHGWYHSGFHARMPCSVMRNRILF